VKQKPTVNLVRFRGEYFPRDPSSFDLLLERGLTVFRIPEKVLPTLMHSLLRGVVVEETPFSNVFQECLSSFYEGRLSTLRDLRWKAERNLVFLSFPDSQLEKANQYISELGFVMGRYGVKVSRENRLFQTHEGKPDRHAVRLECKPDPGINPSEFFRNAIAASEEKVRLNLTSCASLVFNSRPSMAVPGRQAIGVAFEDLLNEEWVQAFSREFAVHSVNEEQVVGLINWLIQLLNQKKYHRPSVTAPTRRK